MIREIILGVCLLAALPADGPAEPTHSTAETTSSPLGPGESYVVIGLQPKNIRLFISPAKIENGMLVKYTKLLPSSYGQTSGGYIVAKMSGGQEYMVRSTAIMLGKSIFGQLYYPNEGTTAFKIPPGKVLYIRDEIITVKQDELKHFQFSTKINADINSAREYLEIHFPDLAPKLEQGEWSVVACGTRHCRR